jgi:hypothetical protein
VPAGVKRGVEAGIERVARRLGYDLCPHGFYSPMPDVERLPDSLWSGPRGHAGVDLRLDQACELLRELDGPVREFAELGFPLSHSYGAVDADVLYAMLRRLEPRRVIELGSGASSHIIQLAREANARDGRASFAFESYDPFPGWHRMGQVREALVHAVPAEELDPSIVSELAKNDVLFVDTAHAVRTGGDVVHIVLDLLPQLAPGVHVHFHDIFIPYEYPREWVVERRIAWAEQYLLQAFLAFNPEFEVVLPAQALWRERPALVRELIPSAASIAGTSGPGAFWLSRAARRQR